jgi:hypothetical protein
MKQKIQSMETTKLIPLYDFAPFCVLEGGRGLHDTENYLIKSFNFHGARNWVLDELYEKPRRLVSLQFLRPKTLIVGTTGVYKDKINMLIDLFFELDVVGLENIILTMRSEDVFYEQLLILRERNPELKFWALNETPSMFDEDGTEYSIYEIEIY